MVFRDLPLEIQSRILEFCSPNDLAVLSRVHTAGRDVAEYALYSRIQYRVRPSDQIKPSCNVEDDDESSQELKEDRSLLHTFAKNSWKASMVKMFYVELEDEDKFYENTGIHDHRTCINLTHFILVKLAEALVKMPNLVDLRILHSLMDLDAFKRTRRISEVIRGDYFKLHTLYIEEHHDLEGIVADKPNLRLLGIHSATLHDVPQIKKLHQEISRRRTMPTVFAVDDLFEGPEIIMSPAFYNPGEAPRACREVATSLTNWHGFFGKDRYHLSVDLLETSEENVSSLSELMEAMATCLQDHCPQGSAQFRVLIHEESIQKPWRFPEFVKPLALFGDVRILNVEYTDIDFEKWYQMATDLEFCMVKKLKRAWPSLQEIRFFCYKLTPDVLVMKRQSNWKVIECTSELDPLEDVLRGAAVVSDDE